MYDRDEEGNYFIDVSEMNNPDYEFLVAIHEMIEQYLIEKRGIKNDDITNFDIEFDRKKSEGLVPDHEEPGDDPESPYVLEHCFATAVERMMCAELGVNWKDYNDAIYALSK